MGRALRRALYRRRIALRELTVPIRIVRIRRHDMARDIKLANLIRSQIPADRTEIFAQLNFVARTDQDGRDGRSLQEPIQCDLRYRLASLLRGFVERVDDIIQVPLTDWWGEPLCVVQAARFR